MKKIILLIIVSSFLITGMAYADDSVSLQKEVNIDSIPDKNPFEPQLPEKPKTKKEKPKPNIAKSSTLKNRTQKSGNAVLQTATNSIKKNLDMRQKIPTQPKLAISGLVWDSDRPQAIVNGQVVDIGDKINENKIEIVSIQKGSIDILFEGERMNITP